MSTARLLIGDVFDRMAEIPDGSIDLVLTSPPFLALRSYLPADHPDKAKEIGSEPTPAAFLDTLLALSAEWRRVLAPHGSICVELGDTYSGSGGGGGDYLPGGLREGQPGFGGSASRQREGNAAHWRAKNTDKAAWPLPKSLVGIPHLYHLSLAYGRNVLRAPVSAAELLAWFELIAEDLDSAAAGPTATELLGMMRSWLAQRVEYGPVVEIEPWRIRNVVAWCRPNPPVGALGDKFRPATSYMTIACMSKDRYFDLDAVRVRNDRTDELVSSGEARTARLVPNGGSGRCEPRDRGPGELLENNPAGAPPLDWWEIPTQPYAGSHYATWPTGLLTKPIRTMVPTRVCTSCGEPSRRLVEGGVVTDGGDRERDRQGRGRAQRTDEDAGRLGLGATGQAHSAITTDRTTTGWTDCGHDTWRTGVVLDPFAGSGTTLAVATGEGREAIGIDLDERNADLVRERVGIFLEVELPATEVPA